eukprot:6181536-Pleurochrysis_carterae.AAC.2
MVLRYASFRCTPIDTAAARRAFEAHGTALVLLVSDNDRRETATRAHAEARVQRHACGSALSRIESAWWSVAGYNAVL